MRIKKRANRVPALSRVDKEKLKVDDDHHDHLNLTQDERRRLGPFEGLSISELDAIFPRLSADSEAKHGFIRV